MYKFNHLREVNLSYYDHLFVSLGYAKEAMTAAIVFFIHGLFPDVFETTGSNIIDKLNNKIKNRNIKK